MKIEVEISDEILALLKKASTEQNKTVEFLATKAVDDAYRISDMGRNIRRRRVATETYLIRYPNSSIGEAFIAGYSVGWVDFQLRHTARPNEG